MTGLTILGSTGSIGMNTLDVLSRHPQQYRVFALTAHRDIETMLTQCRQWRPRYAVMADADAAEILQQRLAAAGSETSVLAGEAGLCEVAALAEADIVVAGIVGAAGLMPTLAAARAGKRILLANKEALVMAGQLFIDEVRKHDAVLLPVDSEHNAVFQCLPAGASGDLSAAGVRRILLTASGGPFRTVPVSALHDVTPEQACAHPNWSMGRKISVDSATMLNKGLEVIEACWLFNVAPDSVDVVIHPQSVVHSLVEYLDGSVLAQLGSADMRIPIANALAWPQRIESGAQRLNLFDVARLDFEPPDTDRFVCLRLAYSAARRGGTAPAILNAANEVAVAAFLEHRLRFTDIPAVIEAVLEQSDVEPALSLDVIHAADRAARKTALACLQSMISVH